MADREFGSGIFQPGEHTACYVPSNVRHSSSLRRSKRRGVAQQHLAFLSTLRQVLTEASGTNALVRAARALVNHGIADYAVVDMTEPPRRLEICHADLSRVETLRAAAARFEPDEGGHLEHVLETSSQEVASATGARPLAAPDLGFARGLVRSYIATPVLYRSRVVAVLTLVATRRRFDADDAYLAREIAGWLDLVLDREGAAPQRRRSSGAVRSLAEIA